MLTQDDFIQDACKSTPGFEFYSKKFMEIKLSNLIFFLKNSNFYISKDNSPFYLHVKKKNLEASIFSSLKIIIKNTNVEEEAFPFLKEILDCVNEMLKTSSKV